MPQNSSQIGINSIQALHRNTQLAVVECSRPTWRTGYIKVSFLGVQDHHDVLRWRYAKLIAQIVVVVLQRGNDLAAKSALGGTFVTKRKMSGLALAEIGFCAHLT